MNLAELNELETLKIKWPFCLTAFFRTVVHECRRSSLIASPACMYVADACPPLIRLPMNIPLPLSSFRVHMEINGEIVEDTI
jgi:hypothetical protein